MFYDYNNRKMSKIFKAAVLTDIKDSLKLKNILIPKITENEILISLKYTFICGTQKNEWLGLKGKDKFLPHLMGHEASGVIERVGSEVKNFHVGEKIFVSWIPKKKSLSKARKYFDTNGKIVNSGPVSTFNQYSIFNEQNLYKSPKNIHLKYSAIFGCAFPTGAGLALQINKVYNKVKNNLIIIYGIGGVGMITLMTLNYLGLNNIIVIDKSLKNLKIAKKFNISGAYTLENFENKIYNQIIDIDEIGYSIEATGNKHIIEKAFKYLRRNGYCLIAGNPKKGSNININPYDIIFGKKIEGSVGGNINIEKNLDLFVSILKKYKKEIDAIFYAKEYDLSKINIAMNEFNAGKILRPLIKIK